MFSSASTENGLQIGMHGSNSRIPMGQKQIQMEVSQEQVIFIANFKRHLNNMMLLNRLGVFHQALLVVTSNKDGQMISRDKKYHLVEYENDSIVKGYKINLRNKDNAKFLKDMTNFADEEFIWEKMSLKKQLDVDTFDITVSEIIKRMQEIADLKGSYGAFSNNCQNVANQLTEQLLMENISNKIVIFLALVEKQDGDQEDGESQPHSALLIATNYLNNGSYLENQKYYIVEYLSDGTIRAYQYYIKNQPENLMNLDQFTNGQSYWQIKLKICQFYLNQTVSSIVKTMKNNISIFFSSSYNLAKSTFDNINKIQEEEKKRLEREREREESERRSHEAVQAIILIGKVLLVCWVVSKIFS